VDNRLQAAPGQRRERVVKKPPACPASVQA